MKLSLTLLAISLSLATCQQQPAECTRELARTDDCADVINANACYNKFKFTGTRALSCIGGANDTERAKKACKCCSCVGTVMCNWVTTNKYCSK